MPVSPLVSVIVPCYNAAAFLEEAVRSVEAQDVRDWEIWLVDDGSTDGTAALAEAQARRLPGRIRCLCHPGGVNRGAAAARNLALRHARGVWLALLDADDLWLPGKLAGQLALADAHPGVSMIGCAARYWYSWADPARPDPVIPVGGLPDRPVYPPDEALALHPLGPGDAPCPSGLLIRKEAARRLGGFEEAFAGPYQMFEDQAFLMKFYLEEAVLMSSAIAVNYRQRQDSVMALAERDGHYPQARTFFLHWLASYLDARGLSGGPVGRQLSEALRPPRRAPWPRIGALLKAGRHILTGS